MIKDDVKKEKKRREKRGKGYQNRKGRWRDLKLMKNMNWEQALILLLWKCFASNTFLTARKKDSIKQPN